MVTEATYGKRRQIPEITAHSCLGHSFHLQYSRCNIGHYGFRQLPIIRLLRWQPRGEESSSRNANNFEGFVVGRFGLRHSMLQISLVIKTYFVPLWANIDSLCRDPENSFRPNFWAWVNKLNGSFSFLQCKTIPVYFSDGLSCCGLDFVATDFRFKDGFTRHLHRSL
jgi:ribosomal protein L37E